MNVAQKQATFAAIARCNLLCEELGCWGVLNRYSLKIGRVAKEVFFFTYKPHKERAEFVGHITWGDDGLFFRAIVSLVGDQPEVVIVPQAHFEPIASEDEYVRAVSECFIELSVRLANKEQRRKIRKRSGGRRDYTPPELQALAWGKTIKTNQANIRMYSGQVFDEVFAEALINLTNQGIVCKGSSKKKTTSKTAKGLK